MKANADVRDRALEIGKRIARLFFVKRGNNTEVHVDEVTLAAIIALGVEDIATGDPALLPTPPVPDDAPEVWLVAGLNCWGRGYTREQAMTAAKSQYSRSLHGPWRKFIVCRSTDAFVFVDDMGSVVHRAGHRTREVERVDRIAKKARAIVPVLLLALMAIRCGGAPASPSAPSLASLLAPPAVPLPVDTRFEPSFYRDLAHGTYEAPTAPAPVRRWLRSPSVYLQRRGLSDAFVAMLEQTFREEIPAFTGGALVLDRFESGVELRPDVEGWIVIELGTDDAKACGLTKLGAEAGHMWINAAAKCARRGEPVAFPSLFAHEMGHALGFYHVAEGLMQPTVTFEQGLTEREKYHGAAMYAQPNGSTR